MAVLNAPGSWHDAQVARPIYQQLRSSVPDGFYLVADSAFPKGNQSVAGKIQVPLKSGQRISRDPTEQEYILTINRQLLSYRQTAEWGMRIIQGSFGRLRVPLNISSTQRRHRLLETCIHLVNIHTRLVGISQIKNVYIPIWDYSDNEQAWQNLKNIVFGEVRRRDRVSQFHLQIVEE